MVIENKEPTDYLVEIIKKIPKKSIKYQLRFARNKCNNIPDYLKVNSQILC